MPAWILCPSLPKAGLIPESNRPDELESSTNAVCQLHPSSLMEDSVDCDCDCETGPFLVSSLVDTQYSGLKSSGPLPLLPTALRG